MANINTDFQYTSNSDFLDFVSSQEAIPETELEDSLFTHIHNESRQNPWKDMHYKRALAQYIKKKYNKSVKVTNKFAEKTYRDFYKNRVMIDSRISRYLKVFWHPDISSTDFEYLSSCERSMIYRGFFAQTLFLTGIVYAYFRTSLGAKIKKDLKLGIMIGLIPFFSIMAIKVSHPVFMDFKLNRLGMYQKYGIDTNNPNF